MVLKWWNNKNTDQTGRFITIDLIIVLLSLILNDFTLSLLRSETSVANTNIHSSELFW